MAIPTFTEFLTSGLSPHTPEDMSNDCSICTLSWHDDSKDIVALSCLHNFHKECIEHWVTEGTSMVATCPFCRLPLCHRPSTPLSTGGWVVFGMETDEEYGWEGLDAAIEGARIHLSSIYSLTHSTWANRNEDGNSSEDDENDIEWAEIVCEILNAINTSSVRPLVPGSVAEYAVVRAIVDSLKECWQEEGLDLSQLEAVLEAFEECEEHAAFCTIDEAYAAAGLAELAEVALRWDSELDEDAISRQLADFGIF
ncbi:hypothetical protein BKA66DRAFT_436281 [Pyrenochaeta sp. MPI-SDFR-AT-0127]|nr:hypothetical protein BKA66DRAFT_436281 [Pyrenochaeta sp. MPI-SDFR-AT-0127]